MEIFEERKGRCSLCDIEGQGSRDFLCADCASPDHLVVYCQGCGQRMLLTDEEKATSAIWSFLTKLPDFPSLVSVYGVSVRLSWCPQCPGPQPEKLTILTYKIK